MDGARTTALVIDDDVCVRALLAELLAEEGFDVTQASNGFSGMRLAIERRPQVILLDLVLPELSGAEVLRELRASPSTGDSAIVIVSGNVDSLSDRQIAEVDAVVPKPFDISYLVASMHQALRRAAHRAAEVRPLAPVPRVHEQLRARRAAIQRHSRGRRL